MTALHDLLAGVEWRPLPEPKPLTVRGLERFTATHEAHVDLPATPGADPARLRCWKIAHRGQPAGMLVRVAAREARR